MRWLGWLLAVVVLGVLGLGGWQWSLYKPQIDTVERQLSRAQVRLQAVNAAASREDDLQKELSERRSLLTELRGAFPASLEMDAFQSTLDTLSMRYGVELTAFDASVVQFEFHERASVTARFRGPESAIDDMISALFLEPRHVSWETEDTDEAEAEESDPSNDPSAPREMEEEGVPGVDERGDAGEDRGTGSGALDDPESLRRRSSSSPIATGPSVETEETFVVYAIPSPPTSEGSSCRADVSPVWMPPFKGTLDSRVSELNSACAKLEEMAPIVELVESYEGLIVETGHIQAIRANIVTAE